MMQSLQPKTFYPKTGVPIGDLEGAIWKSYLNCVDSFQAFQMESEQEGSRRGSQMVSNTFPSSDRFMYNLVVLHGILIGAEWADAEYLGQFKGKIEHAKDQSEQDTGNVKMWIAINALLARRHFFKEKPILGDL